MTERRKERWFYSKIGQISDGGTGSSNAATARENLGLEIGVDVQAYDLGLDDIAALANADGNIIVGDGSNWVAESGDTARTSLGVGSGDSPQFTGVNVGHATDTTVTRASAGDINIEGNIAYRAGGTDVPVTDGGTGASTAADARTNLGIGTGDSPQFTTIELGHATDTTIARVSAGVISVEGATMAKVTDIATDSNLSSAAQAIITNGLVHADVDDTPVNGETTVPVSSNWAYDHNALSVGVHGIPADPGADKYLMWDDSESALAWEDASAGVTEGTVIALILGLGG